MDNLNSSFYYFFSATPQVLAAILALFGVFVIFKIQSLKKQLIGIGQSLLSTVERIYIEDVRDHNDSRMTNITGPTTIMLRDSLQREDTYKIKTTIDGITIIVSGIKPEFETLKMRYIGIYRIFKTLVRRTIDWSILTAILIIFCLATIPFAYLILKHNFFLYIIFSVVIVGISLSFYGLISILKKALNDYEIE